MGERGSLVDTPLTGRSGSLRIDFVAGTLGRGGAERQLRYIMRGLRARGHSVRVLSLTRGEYWESVLRDERFAVEWVGASASRLARLAAVTRSAARNRTDVLHSLHFFANVYAGIAARLLGRRGLGSIRSSGTRDLADTGRLGGFLCLHTPHRIAANSTRAIESLGGKRGPGDRFFLLPNVVDTEKFAPRGRRRRERFTLLFVGRLEAVKRPDRFLEVAAGVEARAGTGVRVLIAGDGPLGDEARRRASDLGLRPGTAEFLGAVDDMAEVYAQADALVVTSQTEGSPNAVLEAMACGLPVVAPRVGGIPELVEDGETGLLLAERAGTPAYVEAVGRLLADEALCLRIGSAARRSVEAGRSLHALPRYLAELYEVPGRAAPELAS